MEAAELALTCSSSHSCSVWDLESGGLKRTREGHAEYVTSVAVTPDGRQLFSGSYDKTVRCVEAGGKRLSWH